MFFLRKKGFLIVISIIVICFNACDRVSFTISYGEEEPELNNGKNNYCTNYTIINQTNKYDVSGFSRYMNQKSGLNSVQGCACYGDYIFQFQDGFRNIYVYNIKSKEFVRTIELEPNSSYHCNNVNFSSFFFSSEDLFPLIYVSQQNNNEHKTLVCRLQGESIESLRLSVVQTIIGPNPSNKNHLYYQDSIIDIENGYYYIYARHSSNDKDNLYIVKFQLPQVSEGDIKLKETDAIASFSFDNQHSSPQGGIFYNGKIFIIKGVPFWKEHVVLNVIDLEAEEWSSIDLTDKGYINEPEGLFVYNDELYCMANLSTGIFLLSVEKTV